MIELDTYDIEPPAEAVRTEAVSKPEPESEPLDIWEFDRIIEIPEGMSEKDRAVLFSGGDDSLALTHLAMSEGWADFVIHLDTNSSIPANLDYVRSVCREFHWPLLIISSPMPLDIFAYRYGFPGPGKGHQWAYNYFKGRQLNYFSQKRKGDVKFFSGVRKLESDRRMENIDAEVQYEDSSDGGNFTGWWLSPLIDKSDEWVDRYRERHDLPQNPVAKRIHRSGDCQCLAYGKRTEELIMIEAEYPDYAQWLLNVEKRAQEYRGRVQHLEDEYPDVAEEVEARRKEAKPNPMKLTVLKNEFPDVFEDVVRVSAEDAILRGRTDNTNYLGHGGLSSNELRNLTSAADVNQKTLCESCGGSASGLANAVEENIVEAAKTLETATDEGRQTTLADLQTR
jgi:3'-phosphoadenosine 5'-phosphosulfate sulfotransferase (PAPS reductase)/FAD synthetase